MVKVYCAFLLISPDKCFFFFGEFLFFYILNKRSHGDNLKTIWVNKSCVFVSLSKICDRGVHCARTKCVHFHQHIIYVYM